ncbi:S-adenosylmethionine--tRNA ribosyltransferase-isomerase [Syntrophotalea carbinolica DSM 2380]|uniref:S-adenosylmethionine:tRNA ribosyltransferase-isomerase n=1 Tax=Syntrophotalea carbinolica (strain DSM 2380 / NBRC 103641 / GraBd1) TaxID=338963 RepID=QUEA_SYNC1|nr:tRNA preQ1(34) S-adenosylmethionine ribosyltransferase-isomerase QueA [Syntrophotalea carbinolica]Q3A3C1.1 RecName: Full=S-adenosylmethionine:tRNA ribosyltransferase-isomerase; AltName: Full=Queuosine biosynthesis protein QueA [Syntrophotalea carbinolica DSM 2380]ABA89136.1 S-adenosylmethionine--tRNA ribosyltransferase-isomerase [Syntrophotalea carbinolica DSM 2380]
MRLSDFDFELPEELIAQHPLAQRQASRLMVLNRVTQQLQLAQFADIADWFRPGDVLVVNDTRVIPARLIGRKQTGGRIEVFLVRRLPGVEEVWACLTKCSKSPRPGTRLILGEGLEGTVVEGGEPPYRHVRFSFQGDFSQVLEQVGRIPLPPYIRREATPDDRSRYQTVFAREAGAVAAPTAGLHFTDEILDVLRAKGVEIQPLTLHVGLGTFLPMRTDDITEHRMHEENYFVPEGTAAAVNRAKDDGRRVIALGTTSTRTLEYAVDEQGRLQAGAGTCDLFIRPGFKFRIVDGLVTNFHLPCSTLLVLVAALAGREFILEAYQRAVAEKFRFFSYGDCMLIL